MECDRKVPGISGSGKKIKTKKALVLFKKGRYLFLKVLDLFKKRPYLLR